MKVTEILLGAGSMVMTTWGTLAQADLVNGAYGLVMQYGGLGLAIFLVLHHTLKTIPNMGKEHKAERQEDRAAFQLQLGQMQADHKTQLAEERKDHAAEMERQRNQFTEMMAKSQCRFKQ